jgi:hypothetical protein
MVEGLLVAELDQLVPDGKRALPYPYLHQPDGRTGGRTENIAGMFVKIGAAVHVSLAAGQFHGKGEAGGIPALLTVFPGKKLVNVKRF